LLIDESRNRNSTENTNNHHNNQQLDQRKAGLELAALLAALQALEEGALGQQLGLETGGHEVSSSVEYRVMIAPPAGAANKGGLSRI